MAFLRALTGSPDPDIKTPRAGHLDVVVSGIHSVHQQDAIRLL